MPHAMELEYVQCAGHYLALLLQSRTSAACMVPGYKSQTVKVQKVSRVFCCCRTWIHRKSFCCNSCCCCRGVFVVVVVFG